METKNYKVSGSGFNPKIQQASNSYGNKYYYENSAVKNTIAEYTKNRTITIPSNVKV